MTAVLSFTPAAPKTGDEVSFLGSGFAENTKVDIEITRVGFGIDIETDTGGNFDTNGSEDVPATAVLTSDGTAPTNNDTVTIGGQTYTFKTALTPAANEVLIGASAAAALQNLKDAINLTGTPGTQYGSATTKNASAYGDTITATTLKLVAITGGTGGNSLASTEASAHLSFGGATFSGGAAGDGYDRMIWHPIREGTYIVTANDGTNMATVSCKVYSSR